MIRRVARCLGLEAEGGAPVGIRKSSTVLGSRPTGRSQSTGGGGSGAPGTVDPGTDDDETQKRRMKAPGATLPLMSCHMSPQSVGRSVTAR